MLLNDLYSVFVSESKVKDVLLLRCVPSSVIYKLLMSSGKLTQHEGHRDETGIVVAINSQLFKIPLLVVMQEKSIIFKKKNTVNNSISGFFKMSLFWVLPVSEADGGVHGKESQKLFIQQSVDAAFPGQK